MIMNDQALSLYITAEHPCGYYSERSSANLVPDPQIPMNSGLYGLLVSNGFRRSGGFVYRPHCPTCEACIPCRIDVQKFKPSRSQKRCLSRNKDLKTIVKDAEFTDEYFNLYQRYMNSRHSDGSMANPKEDDFKNFLLCDWSETLFLETRLDETLLSVAVVDKLSTGYSAVYTFFDPDEYQRSLGTFAILQEILIAQQSHLPYVYLGYWIKEHPKMHYKGNFSGLEIYRNRMWISDETGSN